MEVGKKDKKVKWDECVIEFGKVGGCMFGVYDRDFLIDVMYVLNG